MSQRTIMGLKIVNLVQCPNFKHKLFNVINFNGYNVMIKPIQKLKQMLYLVNFPWKKAISMTHTV